MKKYISTFVVVLLAIVLAADVIGEDVPIGAGVYTGLVTFNGVPAPAGTTIEAFLQDDSDPDVNDGETIVGPGDGVYTLLVQGENDKVLKFKANGVYADQTPMFHGSEGIPTRIELDLSFTSSVETHTVCNYDDDICELVPGSGTDECSAYDDCIHAICNYDTLTCDIVESPGADECADYIPDCAECYDEDTQACDTGLDGVCADGTETCTGGSWGNGEFCVQDVQASAEVCDNGLDDDCDGLTDLDDEDCVGETKISVSPPSQSINVGDTATVTIKISNIQALLGYELTVNFDDSLLDVSSRSSAGFLGGMFVPGVLDVNKIKQISEFLTQPPGVSGSGDLFTVTFTAAAPGTSAITLSGVSLYDDAMQLMGGYGVEDGTITVNGECINEETQSCDTGFYGICADGTQTCVDWFWGSCEQDNQPSLDDNCNGVDENCDGSEDEGYVPVSCNTGAPGICAAGMTQCSLGSIDCPVTVTPTAEVCDNGLDDDCDGLTDSEDDDCWECNHGDSRSCDTGEPGVCAEGYQNCMEGFWSDCIQNVFSSPDDNCNGLDDDCDGTPDDEYVETQTYCGVGACYATGMLVCASGSEKDTCTPGDPAADDATCNLLDDDCDGRVDEDYVSAWCDSGFPGICADGTSYCSFGYEICSVDVEPGAFEEICDNGLDDDCDGYTDMQDSDCGCETDEDCDDGNLCTVDTCNLETRVCDYNNVEDGASCSDELFCNGEETCQAGVCESGVVPCLDFVDCTIDSCNEETDTCEYTPDDSYCDNGLFCDGLEYCDLSVLEGSGCRDGVAPTCFDDEDCTTDSCSEGVESYVCVFTPIDEDEDGYDICEGDETDCDDANASINPGAAEVCDNGVDDDCDGLVDMDDDDCYHAECGYNASEAYGCFVVEGAGDDQCEGYYDCIHTVCVYNEGPGEGEAEAEAEAEAEFIIYGSYSCELVEEVGSDECSVETVEIDCRPDLTGSFTFSPENPTAGETVTIIATVVNEGPIDAVEDFTVTGTVASDPTVIGQETIPGLASGSFVNVTFTWVSVAGLHQLSVFVDSGDNVTESLENNNEMVENITVSSPPPPEEKKKSSRRRGGGGGSSFVTTGGLPIEGIEIPEPEPVPEPVVEETPEVEEPVPEPVVETPTEPLTTQPTPPVPLAVAAEDNSWWWIIALILGGLFVFFVVWRQRRKHYLVTREFVKDLDSEGFEALRNLSEEASIYILGSVPENADFLKEAMLKDEDKAKAKGISKNYGISEEYAQAITLAKLTKAILITDSEKVMKACEEMGVEVQGLAVAEAA
ncbi:MAG: hypothetical protein JXB14_00530 [Candidatus Altiarchaeota archaeon]|nr:hypothetical protein [Candidatus Altiarchaeota archaeon]